ncbi:unnamed protein product [Alopecurus aequalis]
MEALLSSSALLSPLRGSRKLAPAAVSCKSTVSCSLKKQTQAGVAWRGDGGDGLGSWVSFLHHGLAAAALSLAITLAPAPAPVAASEFDVLNDGPPADTYVVDDAGVLSRVTKSDLKRLARDLEARKNIRINFVTVRKLTSKADAFEYADQVLEKWYPSVETGSNKGIVVLVTSQKEGAITGGPDFVKAVGDAILDATVSENLPGTQLFVTSFPFQSANAKLTSSVNARSSGDGGEVQRGDVLDGQAAGGGGRRAGGPRRSGVPGEQAGVELQEQAGDGGEARAVHARRRRPARHRLRRAHGAVLRLHLQEVSGV